MQDTGAETVKVHVVVIAGTQPPLSLRTRQHAHMTKTLPCHFSQIPVTSESLLENKFLLFLSDFRQLDGCSYQPS